MHFMSIIQLVIAKAPSLNLRLPICCVGMRAKVLSLFLIDDRNACNHSITEGGVPRIENRMAEPTTATPSDRQLS